METKKSSDIVNQKAFETLKNLDSLPPKLRKLLIDLVSESPKDIFEKDLRKTVIDHNDLLMDEEDYSKGKLLEYRILQGPQWTIVGDLKISAPVEIPYSTCCHCCKKDQKDETTRSPAFFSPHSSLEIDNLVKDLSKSLVKEKMSSDEEEEQNESDELPAEIMSFLNTHLNKHDMSAQCSKPQQSQSMSAKIQDSLFNLNKKGKVSSDRPNIKGLKLNEVYNCDLWYLLVGLSSTRLAAIGYCKDQQLNKVVVLKCANNCLQAESHIDVPCSAKFSKLL